MIKKLFAKLSNKHFLSLAGNGSMSVLSIITYAILYRLLTKVEMGNWVFFQFAFGLADTLRTGFLQTAFIKFYAGVDNLRASVITGSTWYLALLLTIVLIVADIMAYPFINHIHDTGVILLITWAGVAFLLTLPINIATWVLQAKLRFDQILYIRIVNQGSFILFTVWFYIASNNALDLHKVFLSYIYSSLLTGIFTVSAGLTSIKTITQRSRESIKEIFHFGKFSVGTMVGSSLLKSSDTFIINFMLGPAALAIYNLPLRLLEVIEVPMRSFLATAMPEMSAAANKNDIPTVTQIMKKYAGILTMVLMPISIVAIISSNVIVDLIGGGKYAHTEAANVFRILLVFAMFSPVDRFMGITLDILNKPRLNFIKVLITLAVNSVTDVVGILIFHNIYGPAWASMFTFIVAVIYGYITLRKYLRFTIPGILKLGATESRYLFLSFFKIRTVKL